MTELVNVESLINSLDDAHDMIAELRQHIADREEQLEIAASTIDRFWYQINRFWARVEKTDGCWIWTGHKVKDGYGSVAFGHKDITTHRLSYMLANGAIPDGMLICHTCDNPACVRPDHLWAGTNLENARDKVKKGRQGPRGLTKAQVADIRERYADVGAEALALQYNTVVSYIWQIAHYERRKNG